MAEMRLAAFARSDTGLVRAQNEDAFTMAELASGSRWKGGSASTWSTAGAGVLVAVSDGMGGANAGEVASALSVESLLSGMTAEAAKGVPDGAILRRVIEDASRRVHEAAGEKSDRRGMGATMTAVLVVGDTAFIAQIGDSRAYVLRDENIGQITHDQSYVQMLVDAGVMTPEEAERSPRKNIVLQAMGQETVKVDLGRIQLLPGDRLLLCSDGLTNVLDDKTILSIVKSESDLARAAEELIQRTREGGAPDNVTAILCSVD